MKLTLTIFYILSSSLLFCQAKYDHVWTIGSGKIGISPDSIPSGGVLMDFNATPPALTLHNYNIRRPTAFISDKNGQLLAYTNGCAILNREHQIMANGDTLNPGVVYDEFCNPNGDYPLWQPCLFLPHPEHDSLFYLFHLRADDWLWNPMNLLYSVIDATGDGGKGAVIAKNTSVLSDSIYLGNYVHATRHGNGRDWWIVSPRRIEYDMHVSLFSPEGVVYQGMQEFDLPKIDSTCCISQQGFSTDGSKYFRNTFEGLTIYNFDRCTGLFSDPAYLDWDSLPFGGGGMVTSPNNRFLYLSSGGELFQYDLWAPDLAASRLVVGTYDGTLAPFIANFFWMGRAPDGKIYMNSSYQTYVLHVIHHPDSLGMACHFEQHADTLPALNSIKFPNMVNYRLGPLDPPCSVTTGEALPAASVRAYPNPANGQFTLEWGAALPGAKRLLWYDATGRCIGEAGVEAGAASHTQSTRHWPPGLYFWSLRSEQGRNVAAGRVVVE
ncbi:MAG: hypothetical protein SFV22_11570 [Saprospiraceae bacterium]|nr:hypothetical protein [Saprospiraceae bacterium]